MPGTWATGLEQQSAVRHQPSTSPRHELGFLSEHTVGEHVKRSIGYDAVG